MGKSESPKEEQSPSRIVPTSTPKDPRQQQPISLLQPSQKKRPRSTRISQLFRSVFRSLPILAPACRLPTLPGGFPESRRPRNRSITVTLFGYRNGRVSLSIQEAPMCLPTQVIELAMQTSVLQKEMRAGMVRIALESDKRPDMDKIMLLEEPLWTMYCNGKKRGYGVKREATDEDLKVMEVLKTVSMGAGVLPGNSDVEGPDGELAYMRAHFERVVRSRDSETLYMLSPDGNDGPELSIFFTIPIPACSAMISRLLFHKGFGKEECKQMLMEKLTKVLKKTYSNLMEGIKSCRNGYALNKGNENGEESKFKSIQAMDAQDREIRTAFVKGPKRPRVSKGRPPQINSSK